MNFSPSAIMAGIIFGGFGFVAFKYGKAQGDVRRMVVGVVLIGYPYFVADPLWCWIIGAALTIVAILWKD